MRRFFAAAAAAALLLVMGLQAAAQGSQDDLKKKLQDKLASEWLQKAGWITDYDKARERSKETGKPIFAYFTRSYAP